MRGSGSKRARAVAKPRGSTPSNRAEGETRGPSEAWVSAEGTADVRVSQSCRKCGFSESCKALRSLTDANRALGSGTSAAIQAVDRCVLSVRNYLLKMEFEIDDPGTDAWPSGLPRSGLRKSACRATLRASVKVVHHPGSRACQPCRIRWYKTAGPRIRAGIRAGRRTLDRGAGETPQAAGLTVGRSRCYLPAPFWVPARGCGGASAAAGELS